MLIPKNHTYSNISYLNNREVFFDFPVITPTNKTDQTLQKAQNSLDELSVEIINFKSPNTKK
jgi:hypothetical protein